MTPPEMIEGLEKAREEMEIDADVIFHKESLSQGHHVTLMKYDEIFIVVRYFSAGGQWRTHVDPTYPSEREAFLAVLELFG